MRVTNLKHENSASNNIVLNSDGSVGGDLATTLASKGDYTAWQTYTPVLTQSGTVTATVNHARWAQIGKIVHVEVGLNITGAGSAGTRLECTLPVNAANGGEYRAKGSFIYLDSGTAFIVGSATTTNDESKALFASHLEQAFVGQDPSFAAANGDQLGFQMTYEVA